MTSRSTDVPNLLSLARVAELLDLAPTAVEGLVGARYLVPAGTDGLAPVFALSDVKAFLARNADNGSGNVLPGEPDPADADDLLEALDGRCGDMARRAHDIFVTVFPDAASQGSRERDRFVAQAKARFEAILAVASHGAEVDEALTADLREVGATAAWADSPLPQLLVVLRISRDLVVQTAVEVAEERGGHWSLAAVAPADACAPGDGPSHRRHRPGVLGRRRRSRGRAEGALRARRGALLRRRVRGGPRWVHPVRQPLARRHPRPARRGRRRPVARARSSCRSTTTAPWNRSSASRRAAPGGWSSSSSDPTASGACSRSAPRPVVSMASSSGSRASCAT